MLEGKGGRSSRRRRPVRPGAIRGVPPRPDPPRPDHARHGWVRLRRRGPPPARGWQDVPILVTTARDLSPRTGPGSTAGSRRSSEGPVHSATNCWTRSAARSAEVASGPRRIGPGPARRTTASHAASTPDPRELAAMPRILLVEDNEMNRDMLSRRLARQGFEVAIAVDGPRAWTRRGRVGST